MANYEQTKLSKNCVVIAKENQDKGGTQRRKRANSLPLIVLSTILLKITVTQK
jgi:hypothetical protein